MAGAELLGLVPGGCDTATAGGDVCVHTRVCMRVRAHVCVVGCPCVRVWWCTRGIRRKVCACSSVCVCARVQGRQHTCVCLCTLCVCAHV